MGSNENQIIVTIRCLTYNHELYIRQCLEGFVMQKTNFRFEAIVHDDASKDGTAAIIREYAEKYPNIIKPIFENENQYSKHDGSLGRIMDKHTHGKYVALCEGDDYWIDPDKLQKQVDFLESHPNHSLCFCAHYNFFSEGSMVHENRYKEDIEECPMEDIIMNGGGYMATASMVYKRDILLDFPKWAKNLPVGDLPLMLVCAMKGQVGYINDNMVVYRRNSKGSWSTRIVSNKKMLNSHHKSIKRMWKDFDKATDFKYRKVISKKIHINDIIYFKTVLNYMLSSLGIKK